MDIEIKFNQCRYINSKSKAQCTKPAILDGLCITHFRVENEFNKQPKVHKIDVNIYLSK